MTLTIFVDGQSYTGRWATGKTKDELADLFFKNADNFGKIELALLRGDILVLPPSVASRAHYIIGDEE
jgi:hypothetical protein